MNISLLKKAAIQSLALMIAVVTSSYALKQYQTVTTAASDLYSEDTSSDSNSTEEVTVIPTLPPALATPPAPATQLTGVAALKSNIDPAILNQLSDNFLMIKKPAGSNIIYKFEDLYINKSIELDLTGLAENSLTSDMILRVRGNDMFSGDPAYTEITTLEVNEDDGTISEIVTKDFGKDISQGITIAVEEDTATKLYSVQIQIILNTVYAYYLYEDTDYYYINLRKPSDVYDKIIVIDAGHGGKDGGAVSKNKEYFEKNLNLDILLQLKKLLDNKGIKVYYTRTADDTVFLRPRVTLANEVDADYFISIHCNSNDVTSPNGSEVLYYDNEFKGVKTEDLATLFSEEIGKTIPLKQKGIVERNYEDLFIMDQSLVPTILIEVGYMSNNNDLNFLSKEESRKAVAQGIYNGIMRAYNELPVIN